ALPPGPGTVRAHADRRVPGHRPPRLRHAGQPPGPGRQRAARPRRAGRSAHLQHHVGGMTDRTPVRLARESTDVLAGAGVKAVALTWVDNAGVTRVKTVPLTRLEHAVRWGIGMSPVFDVFCVDDSITTSAHIGGPVGDLRLYPDLDRLTILAGQPGWAWAPVDRLTQEGDVWPACQRSFARPSTAAAADAGLELHMAFELEWFVGRGDRGDGTPPAC